MAPTVGIHWITAAALKPVGKLIDIMGGGFGPVENKPLFGHPKMRVHESGASIHYGALGRQPVVLNVPGDTCDTWSDEALRWCHDFGAHVTRLDVALDLPPKEQARRRLIEMVQAWRRGTVLTRCRKTSVRLEQNDDPEEGWTAYFGKRGGVNFLRAYDRRGPLRLEWEFRPCKDTGRELPLRIHRSGVGAFWRAVAEAMVFPMPWYQELLQGPKVEWQNPKSRDSEFEEVIGHFRKQWGQFLWFCGGVGMTLDDLAVNPIGLLRPDLAIKWLRYAAEAENAGYDVSKIRKEIRCRLKSEHASK